MIEERVMIIASRAKLSVEGSRIRSAFVSAAILLLGACAANAAPKVIEERETEILPPLPGSAIAVDGSRLIVGSFRVNVPGPLTRQVYLYERNASGQWVFVVQLLDVAGAEQAPPIQVALKGNIAAATFLNALHVFELTSSGWVHTALSTPSPIAVMGSDVAIDGSTIVVGGATGRFQGVIFRKNSAGQWGYAAHVSGGLAPSHAVGGDVDISGSTIALGSSGSAFLFTEVNGAWSQSAELRYPLEGDVSPHFGHIVELDGDTLILRDIGFEVDSQDMHMFLRSAGVWSYASSVRNPIVFTTPENATISGNLIAQPIENSIRRSILVYERDGTELRPVAELRLSDDPPFVPLSLVAFNGRTVSAVTANFERQMIVRFDLPADLSQPAIVQDNFQDGNANGWTPSNISNWSVVTSGGSRVYRQTSFVSESRSVLTNAAWTNQSAQAEVTPTAVQGTDRFVGVMVRVSDASNYYYVSLRSSNTVQLRKKVNGAFITLASAPLTFQLNRRYRLRVEAIGARIRAYVDGALVLEAIDTSHAEGSPGLLTWGARADFDNVVVTPNPLRTLYVDSFSNESTFPWVREFGTWADLPPSVDPEEPDPYAHLRNFAQTSTTGKGRAYVGTSTDDMVVQARARATSALVTGGWFGVMARHIDDRNFYYLRLGDGRVSIRKFVNGSFFELAGAPFAVSANVTYTLRLEVIGTSLRGYVNKRFLVEANDSSHAAGRYGLATNRTAVRFDDVLVQQP
jgi:hypothetical protein